MADTVETTHPDYDAMSETWELTDALLAGTRAMKAGGTKWLPKEDKESDRVYNNRLARSVLFNGYGKAVRELARRPFARAVNMVGELPDTLDGVLDAVDDEGREIGQFAKDVLEVAINRGLCHILVDYPPNEAQNLGQERSLGLRARMVLVDPKCLTNWQYEVGENGEKRLTQIILAESASESVDDYSAKEVEYRRVIRPHDYELWQKTDKDWAMVQSGPMSIGKIALVTLYLNRTGYMTGSPALEDLAWLNLAHYQSQSDHRNNLRFARSGMVFIKGLSPQEMKQEIVWGVNHAIKTTSKDADAKIIEHTGQAVGAGENELRHLEEQMETLAMGPLAVRSWGNETAMGKAIDEGKGQCDLQAWVRRLETVLRAAVELESEWVNAEIAEDFGIDIYDDFGLLPRSQQDMDNLQKMCDRGGLSNQTMFEAAKLREMFPPTHTWDEEKKRLDTEGPDVGMMGRRDRLALMNEGGQPGGEGDGDTSD